MIIFQLIAAIFAISMIYVVRVHQKKEILSNGEAWGWYGVWLVFIGLALFPQILIATVQILNFARVFDLLIVMAFMVLSVVVMATYLSVRSIQKRLEEMVRKTAMERVVRRQN